MTTLLHRDEIVAQVTQVLVVLSNDVWLGHDAGPAQHLMMVALRAVENRTWVLRATTTGVSAVIAVLALTEAR